MRDWYLGSTVSVSRRERCNSCWTFLWLWGFSFIDADVSSSLKMINWLEKINEDLLLELNRCVWRWTLCCSTGTLLVQVLICSTAQIHSLWRSGSPSVLGLRCACSWRSVLLGLPIFYELKFVHKHLLVHNAWMYPRYFWLHFRWKLRGLCFFMRYRFRWNPIWLSPFLVFIPLLILNGCASHSSQTSDSWVSWCRIRFRRLYPNSWIHLYCNRLLPAYFCSRSIFARVLWFLAMVALPKLSPPP